MVLRKTVAEMINKVGRIEYKPLMHLSPSHYTALKNCSYKSVLAAAFNRRSLLPSSAQASYGTVLHKMIEYIYRGQIPSDDEFDKLFELETTRIEHGLIAAGHSSLVPLKLNVRGFGLQKGLVKKLLANSNNQSTKKNASAEVNVASADRKLFGRIDLVIERDDNLEIIDFKTGKIKEESLDDFGESFFEIKQDYKDQLKLYASMYFETTHRKPTKLSIIDLAKQKYDVSFQFDECQKLSDEAKQMLDSINNGIAIGNFEPKPSTQNCKFCLYRPGCNSYLNFASSNRTSDVCGELQNVNIYTNGNVSAVIQTAIGRVTIVRLPKDTFDSLNSRKNSKICIFNLSEYPDQNIFSANKYTTLYEGQN